MNYNIYYALESLVILLMFIFKKVTVIIYTGRWLDLVRMKTNKWTTKENEVVFLCRLNEMCSTFHFNK